MMKSQSVSVLFLLSSFLTFISLNLGYVIKPSGECPPYLHNVRCLPNPKDLCNDVDSCGWGKKCCFNGCIYLCMIPVGGSPSGRATKSPFFPPFIPDPIIPPFKPWPLPKPRPDLPPYKPEPYNPDLPPIFVPPPEFPEEPFPDEPFPDNRYNNWR
ncbi:nematocyst expressed protein 4-like [Pelobates fuscus]|uniref:nematocyst expressed protein 4-like n=1 Tax=Pelobates fuscus TaxID=191477 RepID=UPI002FE4F0D5